MKQAMERAAALLLEHGVEMAMPGEARGYIDRGCGHAPRGGGRWLLALPCPVGHLAREESAATIKLNMTLSMTLNFVAITLAIIRTLNPLSARVSTIFQKKSTTGIQEDLHGRERDKRRNRDSVRAVLLAVA